MRVIISILTLCFSGFALAFQISTPMVSNIYFIDKDVGVVIEIDNGKASSKIPKKQPMFFELNKGESLSSVTSEYFSKKYLKKKLESFKENQFSFYDRREFHTKSSDGTIFTSKLLNCVEIDEFNSKCDFLEIKFNGQIKKLSLKNFMKSSVSITAIERVGDYLILGTASQGELELKPEQAYIFNLKTETVEELNYLGTGYVTIIKYNKETEKIWVGSSQGVFVIDTRFKLIKSCPLESKEDKKIKINFSCNTSI